MTHATRACRRRTTWLVPFFWIAAGCSGSPSIPPVLLVTGQWTGAVTQPSDLAFFLTLRQTGERVEGTGEVRSASDTVAVTVSGTNRRSAVNLTLRSNGFADLGFTDGRLAGDSISGALNGSGFSGQTLVLRRFEP